MRERLAQGLGVVELDDARNARVIDAVRVDGVAHPHLAVDELHMRLLDAAVIAAGEHQHFVTAGDHAGHADRGAIGVGC